MTSTAARPPQRFLTLQQVADELSTSHAQVYALVRVRALLAIQIGGRRQWRVEREQLEACIGRLYGHAELRDADA